MRGTEGRGSGHEIHGVSHILKTIASGEHGFGGGNAQQIEEAYTEMRKFIARHLEAN